MNKSIFFVIYYFNSFFCSAVSILITPSFLITFNFSYSDINSGDDIDFTVNFSRLLSKSLSTFKISDFCSLVKSN